MKAEGRECIGLNTLFIIYDLFSDVSGARGSVVVKALCYKPEGRGLDSR
jgi:hypothetical protein